MCKDIKLIPENTVESESGFKRFKNVHPYDENCQYEITGNIPSYENTEICDRMRDEIELEIGEGGAIGKLLKKYLSEWDEIIKIVNVSTEIYEILETEIKTYCADKYAYEELTKKWRVTHFCADELSFGLSEITIEDLLNKKLMAEREKVFVKYGGRCGDSPIIELIEDLEYLLTENTGTIIFNDCYITVYEHLLERLRDENQREEILKEFELPEEEEIVEPVRELIQGLTISYYQSDLTFEKINHSFCVEAGVLLKGGWVSKYGSHFFVERIENNVVGGFDFPIPENEILGQLTIYNSMKEYLDDCKEDEAAAIHYNKIVDTLNSGKKVILSKDKETLFERLSEAVENVLTKDYGAKIFSIEEALSEIEHNGNYRDTIVLWLLNFYVYIGVFGHLDRSTSGQ